MQENGAEDMILATDTAPEFSAVIYSDDAAIRVLHVSEDGEGTVQGTEPLSAVPAGREGITDTSTWLQDVQNVCSCCAPVVLLLCSCCAPVVPLSLNSLQHVNSGKRPPPLG
jgi:hypothetical protein